LQDPHGNHDLLENFPPSMVFSHSSTMYRGF
jgi:hypothetical protein